jgi:glutathione S-transferase
MQEELQHALGLTARMREAADAGNWSLVAELEVQRQSHLQQIRSGTPDSRHRDALAALRTQNDALLERVHEVLDVVETQLSQHQYTHRALRAYVTSGG